MVELLEGRLQMYTTAAENARAAGDSSKQRRLDRGAKVCFLPIDLLIKICTPSLSLWFLFVFLENFNFFFKLKINIMKFFHFLMKLKLKMNFLWRIKFFS